MLHLFASFYRKNSDLGLRKSPKKDKISNLYFLQLHNCPFGKFANPSQLRIFLISSPKKVFYGICSN